MTTDMTFNIALFFQLFAIGVLFIETIYIVLQKPSAIQVDLLILILSTTIMMVGYIFEFTADTKEAALLGITVAYFGKPFAMMASTFFIAAYCGYRIPNHVRVLLSVYSLFIVVVVATNNLGLHNIYYATTAFDPLSEAFSPISLTHGPLYYFYMSSVIVYSAVDAFMAIREYSKCSSKGERKQLSFVFAMIAAGILGYFFYLTGLTDGYDTTMAGCAVSSFFLFILFYRYRLLDVISLAKDQALSDSTGGLLVFDRRGRTVYSNSACRRILGTVTTLEQIREMGNEETTVHYDDSVYSLSKRPLTSHNIFIGTVVEINDITESYNYAERLEKDVRERSDELLHIQRSVIGGLANIVEARNGETGSHIKRTAAYVGILARSLRKNGFYVDILTDEFITRLMEAAPLHDLGKISVSDTILNKPGKLTPEEFDRMKIHTTAGVDVLEKTMRGIESDAYVSLAEEVALYHHEKWDGLGYPEGLSGDQIPLSARIMAVADVYDALLSERCYKPAFSKEKARRIIEESSGQHFDPAVVTAFLSAVDEMEAVS